MPSHSEPDPVIQTSRRNRVLKVFGIGDAGVKVIEQIIGSGFPSSVFVAVNTDALSLAASAAGEKVHVEPGPSRGRDPRANPGRERAIGEENSARLESLCHGADVVFLIAGLGGGTGTALTPALARVAKETRALVLAFVTMPFHCEGGRRQHIAQEGLDELNETTDGVICLPNEKVLKLTDENTSVVETFKIGSNLLAEVVCGTFRLLAEPGLLEIHFDELCELIRHPHADSSFAVAEAMGPARARELVDKLFAHPLLDGGRILTEADAVLVSLVGGPELTMTEVNGVMEQINGKCEEAQVIMGATISEAFRERLSVTLIAAVNHSNSDARQTTPANPEGLERQLLSRSAGTRPSSRFVAPPPALPREEMQKMLARQQAGGSRLRRGIPKMRQTQLPLEIVSKGRFDKSEPTIYKGEDLDVPTYIRRGVSLN